MKRLFLLPALLHLAIMLHSQETIPLYNSGIPNSRPTADGEASEINKDSILIISNVSRPTLTLFLAPIKKANGAAVVIFPGGGYQIIAAGHEGYDVAKIFNKMGISAFVVKYRIPNDQTMIQKEIGPLQDAQRAIQLVRQRAKEWHIDPKRIGIMGFSAGGHLASTAGTHFNKEVIANKNKISLRPDFMILVYPVISFTDSIGHIGSRDQLIGKNPTKEKIKEYSNEFNVSAHTPPTFLVHAKDDGAVPVSNSLYFYEELQKNKIPSEIYLYEKGGHGFGLNNPTSNLKWMDLVNQWMGKNGWLTK
jgi:acetyl esterase/lipase